MPVIVLKDVENTVVKYLNFVIEPIPLVFFFFFFLERAFQETLPLTVEILPKTVEIFTVGFFSKNLKMSLWTFLGVRVINLYKKDEKVS